MSHQLNIKGCRLVFLEASLRSLMMLLTLTRVNIVQEEVFLWLTGSSSLQWIYCLNYQRNQLTVLAYPFCSDLDPFPRPAIGSADFRLVLFYTEQHTSWTADAIVLLVDKVPILEKKINKLHISTNKSESHQLCRRHFLPSVPSTSSAVQRMSFPPKYLLHAQHVGSCKYYILVRQMPFVRSIFADV